MDIVLVNYSAPTVRHVSGMRLWNFGKALARRGHRVVVLTSDHGMEGGVRTPEEILAALDSHDWAAPFHFPVAQPAQRWLNGVRSGKLPRLMRRWIIAHAYLRKGGMFFPWLEAVRRCLPELLEHFRPAWVWSTFGNTDSLNLAREAAQRAGCPWGFDLKDPWENFIPAGFRGLIAGRYGQASLRTANGVLQGKRGERWFRPGFRTLYSGFWERDIRPEGAECEARRIQFFGHVNENRLVEWASWWRGLVAGPGVPGGLWKVAYAGGQSAKFRKALELLEPCGVEFETEDYLPLDQLITRCRRSAATAYTCDLGSNPIHHKAIEMLAHRRPVLVIPGETSEIRSCYREAGVPLYEVHSSHGLVKALEGLLQPKDPEDLIGAGVARFTWEAEAARLERWFNEEAPKVADS